MPSLSRPVLVAGATGYIGSRLIPRLLDAGYPVRALARSPQKLSSRPWCGHTRLEIVRGDLLDPDSLAPAVENCQAVFYLVHSMNPGVDDFAAADRSAAENMAAAVAAAGVERLIYLGGLGDVRSTLSHHLRSRSEVGRILAAGPVPVTVFRAAMIIGDLRLVRGGLRIAGRTARSDPPLPRRRRRGLDPRAAALTAHPLLRLRLVAQRPASRRRSVLISGADLHPL